MERPLREGEGGPYGDLVQRILPDGLALVFMPSLAALLSNAEKLTRSPLTEDQVMRIRDAAVVVVTQKQAVAAVEQSRGYDDVDPMHPWRSWQTIRGDAG